MPINLTTNSIVDYLKSAGQASDYATRQKLAAQMGISNYTGTSSQNTQLLSKLRANASKPATPEPTKTNQPTKPATNDKPSKNASVPIPKANTSALISALRARIKSGQISPQAAAAELQQSVDNMFGGKDLQRNFETPGFEQAYKNAMSAAQTQLYEPMDILSGGNKPAHMNQDGSITIQGTEVKTSTTGAAGTSTTTKFTLPINVTQNLGPGASGDEVTELQNWLKRQGFFPEDQASTGYYGDITRQAVSKWQKSMGMTVPKGEEGYFGPKSREVLAQYGVKTTPTAEDEALFNSPDFQNLTSDQQAAVKSIFDAVSSNDADTAKRLSEALTKAKEYADPYFKSQVAIALDGLTRGFLEADQDLEYNERSLSQKLSDLRSMTSSAKDYLTLEQQADLKKLEDSYVQELEVTQNDMAALGFTDSTRRSKTEKLLSDTKGDLVESSSRRFGKQLTDLDTSLSQSERDTSQQIQRLRDITKQNKTALGRKAEETVGSENLPDLPGYKPMGGVIGTEQQNYFQDIFNAANKFVF